MTNDESPTAGQKPEGSPTVVTVAEFSETDLSQFSTGRVADVLDLREQLGAAITKAEAEGNETSARVFGLLSALIQFHFKPSVNSEPYGPMWVIDGKRSAIPSDFRGKQSEILSQVARQIGNVAIRARVADVAWINNKGDHQSAEIAINAYFAIASALIEVELKSRFQKEAKVPHEFVSALQRGAAISAAIRKGGALNADLATLTRMGRHAAGRARELHAFLELQKLSLRYGIDNSLTIAEECWLLSEELSEATDPISVNALLNLAADAFNSAGEPEKGLKARISAAEQYVRMADMMASSPMAASSWLMDAIAAFRRSKDTKDRRREIEAKLREAQQNVFDEMGTISSDPIDLTDIAESRIKVFSDLSLGQALGQLACLRRSSAPEQLREEALASAKESPLAAMLGGAILDGDGKVISENPGAHGLGEPDRDWFIHQYSRREDIGRGLFIAGELEPVRKSLVSRLDFGVRHFGIICNHSPFVPNGHESIYASGFSAFMHGDMTAAVYGLVPQLENSIRAVLRAAGEDASIIKADLIQEDTNLSSMLSRHRPDMESIFGDDIVLEIELLFDHRAGPSLRHQVAHGKIDSGKCYSATCRYACWFIFRLVCLPLFEHWGQISSMIDDMA